MDTGSMELKRRRHPVSRRPRKSPGKSLPRHSDFTVIGFKDCATWAAIFAATLAAYLPALQGTPLWDDDGHLTKPSLQSLHGLWRIWFEVGATQQYYPLLHTAFWMEHRIWGDAMIGYHLINIAFHAVSACLIVLIMRRLSLPGSWLAGFVFALHPVCVESVAWISEQKSTLSGAFYLAALLMYLRFDEDRRRSKYFLALGLFVLALLTKTVTATLPVVILVIFWWRRGLEGKRDALPLLPWFAIGISAGLFTAWVERTLIGARGADFLLTPAQRILIAGHAICFYFGKLLWPANLMFFYPHWNVDPGAWRQWLFPAAVLLCFLGCLGFAAIRRRGPLASLFLYTATLFPVLGFLNVFPFRYSYVADHFQYLATLGIIVPGIALLVLAIERTSARREVRVAGSIALITIFGILTWQQSRMYCDEATLYRTSLTRNPNSWLAHYNLGLLLGGNLETREQAIAEFQAAARIKPDYADAHTNLAVLLANTGRIQDAIAEYGAALKDNPNLAETHYDLGNLLSRMPGRQQEAIAEYQAALRINSNFAEAHANLGIALAGISGRSTDAITELRAALHLKPDLPEAHNFLGLVLSRIPGRLPDAIAEYEAALRARPDYAEAHFFLGTALSQIPERRQDAIAEFEAVKQISPDQAGPADARIKVLRSQRGP